MVPDARAHRDNCLCNPNGISAAAGYWRYLSPVARSTKIGRRAGPISARPCGARRENIDSTDTSAYHAYLFWLEKHPSFELKPPPASGTAKAYHDALEALLKEKSVKPEDTAAWLTEYDELQTKGAEAFLQSRQKTVNTLKDDIEKTGFTLVPAGFIARWDDPQRPSGFYSRLGQFWPHLFGVLVTAGLLTLGAPFWFNLLKNLTSLRPAVANLIEKRPTSAPALPATPTTPPSSS